MPSQVSFTQILEILSGGPDATVSSLVLRGVLICGTLIAFAQLVTMWSTQWGDRHLLSKSLVLSVLFHLCLGLGWATVVKTAPAEVVAESVMEPAPTSIQLIAEEGATETFARSTLEHANHTARRTMQDRPNTEFAQASAPLERPRELTAPIPVVPAEPLRDVPPESPVLEQPIKSVTAARTVAEVKEASLPVEARTEQPATARTRTAPARVEGFTPAPTPTLTPTTSNPSTGPQMAPVSTPKINEARPVPVAMAPRIDRRPTIQAPNETNGTLRGFVIDAATGQPIAGTTIRFDRAQGKPVTATTREDGSYELALPGMPDTFAVTASQEGYVPDARNMRASDVAAKTGRLDFRLRASTDNLIVLEKQPVIHHLGNDQFEGQANSRFQRQSEGSTLTVSFDVTVAQLRGPSSTTAVKFSAKGVQCAPNIWVNGHRLPPTADLTPADGSYGDLVYPFDRSWLQAGKNEIKIAATICNGDLDDFEFVNVQIRLTK